VQSPSGLQRTKVELAVRKSGLPSYSDDTAHPLPILRCREEWEQYTKPHLELADWEAEFKYIVNVEGNCGSARLARQLMGDAVVFLVAGEDQEWCAPRLRV